MSLTARRIVRTVILLLLFILLFFLFFLLFPKKIAGYRAGLETKQEKLITFETP